MSWRETLGVSHSKNNPLTHNPHNTQNPPEDGNCAYCADIAYRGLKNNDPPAMTAKEETAVRAWCASIGETDRATIDEVVDRCQGDIVSRKYLLELPTQHL